MPDGPDLHIDLVREPRGLALRELVPFPAACGAECLFVGRTRLERHAELGPLLRLEYEAHESMARAEMKRLAVDATARFDCRAVRLLHALGPVEVGAASVLIQVACGHRDAAFAACRHLIDALKASVPIWKREVWERGDTWSPGVAAPRQESAR